MFVQFRCRNRYLCTPLWRYPGIFEVHSHGLTEACDQRSYIEALVPDLKLLNRTPNAGDALNQNRALEIPSLALLPRRLGLTSYGSYQISSRLNHLELFVAPLPAHRKPMDYDKPKQRNDNTRCAN